MKIDSVLVIDDEDDLREELIEMLSYEGYKVIGAKNGKQGIYLAKKFLPDLIICDIMMPEMDGWEVLSVINELPQTEGTPFIFLSALSSHANIREGMVLGADDYLVKPFTITDLLNAIGAREKKAQKIEYRVRKTISKLIEDAENMVLDFSSGKIASVGLSIPHKEKNVSEDKKSNPVFNVNSVVLRLIEMNTTLDSLKKIINTSLLRDDLTSREQETFIALKNKLIEPSIIADTRNLFFMRFDQYKPEYLESIKKQHPDLSNDELLLCCSVYLKLSGKQISQIFGIEASSVYKNKYRLKIKLGLPKNLSLENYLESCG